MHRTKHRREPDIANSPENNVQCHIDLGILPSELLGRNVNATAGGDDDADGLIDDVDALEDVDRVVVIGGGDSEDVDGVHEAVDDSVPALDADDDLAAGGGQGIVADGIDGGIGVGVLVVVGLVVFSGGEGEAGLAEGGERDEGSGGREPLAGLEENVGAIGGLEREG